MKKYLYRFSFESYVSKIKIFNYDIGQSYEHSTIIIYDSTLVIYANLLYVQL